MIDKNTMQKKLENVVVMFLFLVTIAGCQNNSNSDVSADSPKIIGNFPLKEHWRRDFDRELNAMALGSGTLVTGIVDDDSAEIQAFDIATGSSLWKHEFPGDSIGIKITIVDKLVYVLYAPKLIAVNLNTGNLFFVTDIGASIGDEIVAFTDKHIFVVQVSEGAFAYDRFTGKPSWQILVGRGNVDVFPDTINGLVYIVHGEHLRAINEQDGSLAWKIQIGLHGAVEYHNGILYYSASKAKGEAETQIHALDVGTRSQLWENELGNEVDCLTMENNGIIAITAETIAMMDTNSGENVWEYYLPLGVYCPPVTVDGVIYLKDGSSNQVIAMEQDNGNLNLLGRLDFEDSGGIGYKIPKDNLLNAINPFSVLVFYLKNSVYVYR